MRAYKLVFNEEDETTGIVAMGFVDKPAIEVDGMLFSELRIEKFKANDKKKQITAPYMVPDHKMKRADKNGVEYTIEYDADTIEKYAKHMMKNKTFNDVNIHHEFPDDTSYVIEHWRKTTENDKSNDLGFDLPIGTAFITYQLTDEMYEKFDSGELNGLSIELAMTNKNLQEIMKNEKEETELFSMIKNFFSKEKKETENFEETATSTETVETATETTAENTSSETVETATETTATTETTAAEENTADFKAKYDEMVENLNKLQNAFNELAAKQEKKEKSAIDKKIEELEQRLNKQSAAPKIEAAQGTPAKAFKDMTLTEQINYNLTNYAKRHNIS